MNYSKNDISDMLDNLKTTSKDESTYTYSHLSASNMKTYCDKPNGEDAWTAGCEDSW